jgi:Flp pilus assembly protein CpaB
MKRKLTGSTTVAIALFVTSGMLASLLGARQFDRISTVPSLVLNSDILPGQVITSKLIKQGQVNADTGLQGVQNPRALIGQTLAVKKQAGEAIYPEDLARSKKVPLSHAIPEGRVLFSLKQPQSGIPASQLNKGDRLDIIVRSRHNVRTVATDVQLIGVLKSKSSSNSKSDDGVMNLLAANQAPVSSKVSLVMAVKPEDVYPLASINSRDTVSLVLHSALDIANGKQHYLGRVATHRNVEVISGLARNTVKVKRTLRD